MTEEKDKSYILVSIAVTPKIRNAMRDYAAAKKMKLYAAVDELFNDNPALQPYIKEDAHATA